MVGAFVFDLPFNIYSAKIHLNLVRTFISSSNQSNYVKTHKFD